MPLVITINSKSGELQSDISLLSLCNTSYLRHFPSCCGCTVELFFYLFFNMYHMLAHEWRQYRLYCLNVYVFPCTSMCESLLFVQFDISTPHTRVTWSFIRDSVHVRFTHHSTVNRPDLVIQGCFLKSVSSHVQKFGDAFGSVTRPVWVTHWQGC